MPFVSQKQNDKCWAMKARGQGKGWNCKEWARKTNYRKLPEKKGAAEVIAELEKRAATPAQLLGVRAAALLLAGPGSTSASGCGSS